MWAAAALVDPKYHEIVINAHVQFIESGSKIISTNSYATQPNYYSKVFGLDLYEGLLLEHAEVSAELANLARQRCANSNKGNVHIYGSLGPICESHQPGLFTKYAEEKGSSFCIDFYEKLSLALYNGGIDGYIVETMNTWEEAFFALEGINKTIAKLPIGTKSLPVIVSFEGGLRNNDCLPKPQELGPQYIKKFLSYIDRNPNLNIIGFGLNCANPEEILSSFQCIFDTKVCDETNLSPISVKRALESRDIKICVYPNLNECRTSHVNGYDVGVVRNITKRVDLVSKQHDGFCNFTKEIVQRFRATYIGGCCGCTPDGIKRLFETYN